MDIFGECIPDKALTNFDLIGYVKKPNFSNSRAVFMRDTLPKRPTR